MVEAGMVVEVWSHHHYHPYLVVDVLVACQVGASALHLEEQVVVEYLAEAEVEVVNSVVLKDVSR